jgi:hypothetical protein
MVISITKKRGEKLLFDHLLQVKYFSLPDGDDMSLWRSPHPVSENELELFVVECCMVVSP